MINEPEKPEDIGQPDAEAPVFGVWNTWYALVVFVLIVIIVLLTIFSRMFV